MLATTLRVEWREAAKIVDARREALTRSDQPTHQFVPYDDAMCMECSADAREH